MKNLNVEAEHNELVLKNESGDHVIIPANKRGQVKKWIKEGCHGCIDGFVETLPIMEQYAGDGTVVPAEELPAFAQPTPSLTDQFLKPIGGDVSFVEDTPLENRVAGLETTYNLGLDDYYKNQQTQWQTDNKNKYYSDEPDRSMVGTFSPTAAKASSSEYRRKQYETQQKEQESSKYAKEATASHILKSFPYNDAWKEKGAEAYLNSLTPKEQKYVKDSEIWSKTSKNLLQEVEQGLLNTAYTGGAGFKNKGYTQETYKDPHLGTSAMAALEYPSKVVQGALTGMGITDFKTALGEDYNFYEGLSGTYNDANMAQDILSDPFVIKGALKAGFKGAVGLGKGLQKSMQGKGVFDDIADGFNVAKEDHIKMFDDAMFNHDEIAANKAIKNLFKEQDEQEIFQSFFKDVTSEEMEGILGREFTEPQLKAIAEFGRQNPEAIKKWSEAAAKTTKRDLVSDAAFKDDASYSGLFEEWNKFKEANVGSKEMDFDALDKILKEHPEMDMHTASQMASGKSKKLTEVFDTPYTGKEAFKNVFANNESLAPKEVSSFAGTLRKAAQGTAKTYVNAAVKIHTGQSNRLYQAVLDGKLSYDDYLKEHDRLWKSMMDVGSKAYTIAKKPFTVAHRSLPKTKKLMQESVDKGNEYAKNWISNPQFFDKFARLLPPAERIKVKDAMMKKLNSGNFKTELSSAFKDPHLGQKIEKIASGNFGTTNGVSYSNGQLYFEKAKSAVDAYMSVPNGKNLSEMIESVTIHETFHNMMMSKNYKTGEYGQSFLQFAEGWVGKRTGYSMFDDAITKAANGEEITGPAAKYLKKMSKEELDWMRYASEADEVQARMMQLRKEFKLELLDDDVVKGSPLFKKGTEISTKGRFGENLMGRYNVPESNVRYIFNQINSGKSTVSDSFADMLRVQAYNNGAKDLNEATTMAVKALQQLLNNLPILTGITALGAASTSQNSDETNAGN